MDPTKENPSDETIRALMSDCRKDSDYGMGRCYFTAKEASRKLRNCRIDNDIVVGGIASQMSNNEMELINSAEDCVAIGCNHYWVETKDGLVIDMFSESESHYGELYVSRKRPDNYITYHDSF